MSKLSEQEILTVATYDKIAEIWSANHHQLEFWQQEMRRLHELLPGGRIIDIGAGGARDAVGLTSLGYKYVGTDISDGLLEIARNEMPSLRFYKQSLYELKNLPEKNFDGFWCSAVLLHIPKTRIDKALQSIKTIIKPRGVGFFSLKDGLGERVEHETWDDGSQHDRFFSYWLKKDFEIALGHNGYSVLDYQYRPDSEKTKWHCFFVRTS